MSIFTYVVHVYYIHRTETQKFHKHKMQIRLWMAILAIFQTHKIAYQNANLDQYLDKNNITVVVVVSRITCTLLLIIICV